jgi:hypothetical protein
MLNKDKYKTEGKRCFEFQKYCDNHNCFSCPLGDKKHCTFAWLELKVVTSDDMISDLIENVLGEDILSDKELGKKLLLHRDEIQKIWKEQDKEKQNG